MSAAPADNGLSLIFAIPFLIVWSVVMGHFLLFSGYFAPRALNRWADRNRFKIVGKGQVGPFKRLTIAASSAQVVYEITVIDDLGATRSGLIKIGDYWWWKLTVDCPIEVTWDKIMHKYKFREL